MNQREKRVRNKENDEQERCEGMGGDWEEWKRERERN